MTSQVFEGLKVADFTWVAAGPTLTSFLAAHGALVIRIESINRVEVLRMAPPYRDGIPGPNRSGYFARFNANKYGVTINLNHPRGLEVVKRLIAWCDLVTESFAPGAMKRWGLTYEDLRKIKPDLIMLSSSNQGQVGPHAHHPGHGGVLTSLAGFTHFTGWPDREPCQPYGALTDFLAPPLGAAVLLAALDHRARTGEGQYIDLSQCEAGLHFLAPALLDYWANGREGGPMGNRDPNAAPHGAFRCQGQDRWCAITVRTQKEWQGFCRALGNPPWTQDPRFTTLAARKANEDALETHIEEWTRQRSAGEVMTLLQREGVPAGVVQSAADLFEDPQLAHRGHLQKVEHSEIGTYTTQAPPFHLSRTPARLERGAPCMGEHNEYVFKELLGMSEEEYVSLLVEGVLE